MRLVRSVPADDCRTDPKCCTIPESSQRALQHIKNCASCVWGRTLYRYIDRMGMARAIPDVSSGIDEWSAMVRPRLGSLRTTRDEGAGRLPHRGNSKMAADGNCASLPLRFLESEAKWSHRYAHEGGVGEHGPRLAPQGLSPRS